MLDTLLINHFLDLVEETRGDSNESFNYDVIRLIMVLNEQYMMSGFNENLVLDVLSNRMGISDTFSANLIFMLNRSSKYFFSSAQHSTAKKKLTTLSKK